MGNFAKWKILLGILELTFVDRFFVARLQFVVFLFIVVELRLLGDGTVMESFASTGDSVPIASFACVGTSLASFVLGARNAPRFGFEGTAVALE